MDGFRAWQYGNGSLLLVQSGIGKDRTESVVRHLLATYPVKVVIATGFAGALVAGLKAGDLVLCTELSCRETGADTSFRSDPALSALAERRLASSKLTWLKARSVTVPRPVLSRKDKEGLGRLSGAAVCQMEDFWSARLAAARGIAFLSVRAVIDEMAMDLPRLDIDDSGDFSPGGLMRKPGNLLKLPALYARAGRAKRSLAEFMPGLIGRLVA